MAQMGMDTEQMGTLGKSMQREAGQLRTLAKQLDAQLRGAWWKGTDADRFRSDWDGNHRPGLEKLAAAFETVELHPEVIATSRGETAERDFDEVAR
jgi:hypothetical protein